MRLALALTALLLAGCASTTAWGGFSRIEKPDTTPDVDWQECHDRSINKPSYLATAWLLVQQAKHEPEILACMEQKGYVVKAAQP